MSKIKLVASDLDGTLLLNSAQSCNPELFPLIDKMEEKGIYFVAASGRQYLNLQRLFAPVKDKIMYLCENGALVMHMDQVLVKKQFEDQLALDICHAVISHPDCEILISGERTSYLVPKSDQFVAHVRDTVGNHMTVVDTPERIAEPIVKISYFIAAEKRDAETEIFRREFPEDRCIIVTSGNEWVDFAPLGTSKGSALKMIGEKLGIAPQEMAAFGDNENDRTMLEFVGHPYLMQNCNPSMKNITAECCCKVEDSLKKIIS